MRLVSVSNRVTVILLFKPRWHTTHSPHSTETKSKTHLVAVVLVSDTNCYAIPISLGLFRLLLWPEMPTTKNNSQRRSSCVFCIDTKRPLNLRCDVFVFLLLLLFLMVLSSHTVQVIRYWNSQFWKFPTSKLQTCHSFEHPSHVQCCQTTKVSKSN